MTPLAQSAHQFLHTPLCIGMLAGLVAAVKADREAFLKWRTWHDVEGFDWNVATFRYVRGAVLGALTGAGIAGLL